MFLHSSKKSAKLLFAHCELTGKTLSHLTGSHVITSSFRRRETFFLNPAGASLSYDNICLLLGFVLHYYCL